MLESYAWLVAMIPDGVKVFLAIAELVCPKTTKSNPYRRRHARGGVSYSRKTGPRFSFMWESETIQEEHRNSGDAFMK